MEIKSIKLKENTAGTEDLLTRHSLLPGKEPVSSLCDKQSLPWLFLIAVTTQEWDPQPQSA